MPNLYLDNDFEYEYKLTQKNATTGVVEAATGLSGLSAHVSASDGGATINAALSVNASERGTLGIYYGVVEGDDLRTHLATYIGTKVWIVFGDSTNVYVSDPYTVVERRRSG